MPLSQASFSKKLKKPLASSGRTYTQLRKQPEAVYQEVESCSFRRPEAVVESLLGLESGGDQSSAKLTTRTTEDEGSSALPPRHSTDALKSEREKEIRSLVYERRQRALTNTAIGLTVPESVFKSTPVPGQNELEDKVSQLESALCAIQQQLTKLLAREAGNDVAENYAPRRTSTLDPVLLPPGIGGVRVIVPPPGIPLPPSIQSDSSAHTIMPSSRAHVLGYPPGLAMSPQPLTTNETEPLRSPVNSGGPILSG
jgi:hypothetical protein